MTLVASSIFSYSLSLVGGIIALVLFSLLNYVSSGFQQTVQYVTDPNKTISDNQWLNKWPSYFTSQIRPTCQPLDFDVNTDIFTNQTGLIYTLTNVWQRPDNGTGALSSSLTYLNNRIQNCVINTIQVDLESEDRSGAQYAFSMWGQNVLVGCFIEPAEL
ncbi:MAG: hypothetical protein FRX48_07668 [Lasallia pustulata]|uniref:Uncharacterized protein n=1 Tax=Lasallia pustulata TaxID=136370 RepID=A0A5M8PIA2_9LECA|nr:MAG: hypothetical protein FRX48_07668 [Lasallia pustulata]